MSCTNVYMCHDSFLCVHLQYMCRIAENIGGLKFGKFGEGMLGL